MQNYMWRFDILAVRTEKVHRQTKCFKVLKCWLFVVNDIWLEWAGNGAWRVIRGAVTSDK